MDRSRRDQPGEKTKTSLLIQQLAAQRERKLQAAAIATQAPSTYRASARDLPAEQDGLQDDNYLVTQTAVPAKPFVGPQPTQSRLIREDRASLVQRQQQQQQQQREQQHTLDDLTNMMGAVAVSSSKPSSISGSGRDALQLADSAATGKLEEQQQQSRVDLTNNSSSDSEAGCGSCDKHTHGTIRIDDSGGHSSTHTAARGSSSLKGTSSSRAAGPSSSRDHRSTGSVYQHGSHVTTEKPTVSHLASDENSTAPESLVLEGGFVLDGKIASKLYPHQVVGVKWLWSLHRMRRGGILADDMGLGKTMQCSAFLAGSLRSNQAFRALVIAPKTLLAHWKNELRVCGMHARTHSFYGSSEGERAASLRAVTSRGGVLLTTYGMVLHNAEQLKAGLGRLGRDVDENEDELDPFQQDIEPGRRILWDYVILDEGHKIKNSRTQLAQRLRQLRAAVRIIISGTPVQNNLGELHALLDFAVPGLLGGQREFKVMFEKPITAGQDRDALYRVRELGAAKAAELRRTVGPFMLRRKKKEILGDGSTNSSVAGTGSNAVAAASDASSSQQGNTVAGINRASSPVAESPAAAGPGPMGAKHDLVVWLRLQPLQRHIYEAFLHSDAVKAALNSSKSPLAALTVLKKVCDHPALLSGRATKLVLSAASRQAKGCCAKDDGSSRTPNNRSSKQHRNSLDDFIVNDDSDEEGARDEASGSPRMYGRAAVAAQLSKAEFTDEFMSWAAEENLEKRLLADVGQKGTESSCKSLFVTALLEQVVAEGHRTLVFSQSRVMLDILQAAVVAHGWQFCRIDGSMGKIEARQAEVERFQAQDSAVPVFLLTTQVGGLGLTLTAANRVVIVDPSWNPATDNQSVDRAYRIGQARDVIVYRLVTCGTVEEKIYRKQVFKGGLSKAGMEEGVQLRYFNHQELHELFKWDPEALNISETQQLLHQQHQQQLSKLQKLQLTQHVGWLEGHPLCAGTSEHGLLFSQQDPEGNGLLSNPKAAIQQHSGYSRGIGLDDSSFKAGPRHNMGKGAAGVGDSGSRSAAQLSSMLSSMSIAGGSSGSAADAYAAAVALKREKLLGHMKQCQSELDRVTGSLMLCAASLPDGGARLKARQQALQAELEAAQKQLQQLTLAEDQLTPSSMSPLASASSGPASMDITNSAAAAGALHQPSAVPNVQGGQQNFALPAHLLHQQPQQKHHIVAASHQTQQPQQQHHLQQLGWQQVAGPTLSAIQVQQLQQVGQPLQQQCQQLQQQQPREQPQRQHLYTGLLHDPQADAQSVSRMVSSSLAANAVAVSTSPKGMPFSGSVGSSSSSNGHLGQAHASSQATSSDAAGKGLPSGMNVETLDGRVPSLAELKQRKHVLKKALHKIEERAVQLTGEGQQWSAKQRQQHAMMYAEYNEIRQLLLQVKQLQQQGLSGGWRSASSSD